LSTGCFFEQDPKSPDAVVPVYFSFPDTIENKKDFALKYMESLMRYYLAFYTNQPDIITGNPQGEKLTLQRHFIMFVTLSFKNLTVEY